MARIKFGMIVVDGRGKLGGHVLSKNRAGAYARTKVTPVNPQTSYQTAARSLFASISQAWSGLSQASIDGWNEAVNGWQKTDIFGDLKQPSGKALFQRLNNQAQSAGFPAVLSAPEHELMPSGVITAANLNATLSDLAFPGMIFTGVARVMIFATPPLSRGTSFVKNRLRLIDKFAVVSGDPSATYAAYVAKYGVPELGSNIYFGIKYVLPNGQASPLQVIQGIVS
jgi:hypothetical protein